MAFKILQWNARSAVANRESLQRELHHSNFSAAALSETWFKPRSYINFKGYSTIRADRNDGKGGVALLIRRSVPFKEVTIDRTRIVSFQICAVRIQLPTLQFTLMSVYCPPRTRILSEEWEAALRQLVPPYMICGDFNAHHTAWGCPYTDTYGRSLMTLIENYNFVLLNDGSPTMVPSPFQRPSAVDVTFCSSTLSTQACWLLQRDSMGSNHFPIELSLGHPLPPVPIRRPTTLWNIKSADWGRY